MDLLFTFLLLLIKELFFLSRNSLFFYSSGVSLGLIMSLLLLVYILHRLIPGVRKNGVGSMLRLIPRVFSIQKQLVVLFMLHRLIPGVRRNGVGSMLRPNPGVFSFQKQLVLLFIWPWLFKRWIALSTG